MINEIRDESETPFVRETHFRVRGTETSGMTILLASSGSTFDPVNLAALTERRNAQSEHKSN